MKIDEFIDTYSDDLLNLHEARAALITRDYAFIDDVNASFCRIHAVFVIGGIEVMLESWRDRDRLNVLEAYFDKKTSNGERIKALHDAFLHAGIQVDRHVFDDYLAIKYLRNPIVHGGWKDHEKEWLEQRGFPTDTRRLTKQHLDKIEHANQNMMLYIALTGITGPDAAKPAKLVRLDQATTQCLEDSGILRIRDIDRIIWSNLERIDAHILADIQVAATCDQYNWAKGRKLGEIEALRSAEQKWLFYGAARRAGEEGYPALVRHRALAQEAVAFWREYWRRAMAAGSLDESRIEQTAAILDSSRAGGKHGSSVAADDAAIREVGEWAYEFFPNIMPLTLLTRLPIVDPANTSSYIYEARRALNAVRLGHIWYACVENRDPSNEAFSLYERIVVEFGASD
jgi:hypothetical protein